jgi:hypothetical protein
MVDLLFPGNAFVLQLTLVRILHLKKLKSYWIVENVEIMSISLTGWRRKWIVGVNQRLKSMQEVHRRDMDRKDITMTVTVNCIKANVIQLLFHEKT